MILPRHAEIWFPGYVQDRLRSRRRAPVKRVWLAFTDHFEPLWNHVDEGTGIERVGRWVSNWPRIASKFRDSAGRQPRYTFFYPEEEYRPQLLSALEPLVEAGIGDVEIHLHHDHESEQRFVDRMSSFIETLRTRHGFLHTKNGKPVFGFIHGLWALDNSRPDGRFCGLNNEITLLRDLGCYADFTMPSGPAPTQVRLLNTIYWAVDDPNRPKSHDTGIPVSVGGNSTGDLLLIPGPFGIRWNERIYPRLEVGELASYDPPNLRRVRRWLDLAPRVGDDMFLKLHTHGTQERHSQFLLGGGLERTIELVSLACAEAGYDLCFASAWEMRQAVDAAQEGKNLLDLMTVELAEHRMPSLGVE
jgi:hypothetical protein